MAKQVIGVGSSGNDGTGDDLRTAGGKINDNFTELYTDVAALQVATGGASSNLGVGFDSNSIVFEGATADSFETTFTITDPTKDNIVTLPDSTGTVLLDTTIGGSVANAINGIVDSAYIALRSGIAQDSSQTLLIVRANSIDSGLATALIDSAYVTARAPITSTLDSAEVQKMIDSNGGLDSSEVQAMIDSNRGLDSSEVTTIIDSDYVRLKQLSNFNYVDSGAVETLVDSDYVLSRTTQVNLNAYTVANKPNNPEHGALIFVKNGASGDPCLAVFDSDTGAFRRIVLGAAVST